MNCAIYVILVMKFTNGVKIFIIHIPSHGLIIIRTELQCQGPYISMLVLFICHSVNVRAQLVIVFLINVQIYCFSQIYFVMDFKMYSIKRRVILINSSIHRFYIIIYPDHPYTFENQQQKLTLIIKKFIIFLMGNSNSLENSSQYLNYRIIQQRTNNWAGKYTLIQGSNTQEKIIKKVIYLKSHEQAINFIQRHNQQQKLEFYVINPLHIMLVQEQRLCNFSQTVQVFHKPLLSNLADKMRKNRQILKQHEIWFIINEISHSLRLLHGKGHPHLWICPYTIFYNQNQNWFLHDTYYWRGMDYQSNIIYQLSSDLIKQKLNNKELISNQLKLSLSKNQNVDLSLLMDEDVYNFGYSVLYMMTMADPFQVRRNYNLYFQRSQSNYSQRLVYLVKLMIHEDPDRRMTLDKLKHRLKMQEDKIMKEQMAEFKKQRSNSRRNQIYTRQKERDSIYTQKLKRESNRIMETPQTHPTQAQTNYSPINQSNRKNFTFFSPPSHRLEQRNGFNNNWVGPVNQFRYNSPR